MATQRFTEVGDVDEDYVCARCHQVLSKPVICNPCEDIFCRDCVANLRQCPTCDKAIVGFSKPHRLLLRAVEATRVRCSDCGAEMTRADSYAHTCAPKVQPAVTSSAPCRGHHQHHQRPRQQYKTVPECDAEILCAVCNEVWAKPVQCNPCGHTCCRGCLQNTQACPTCNAPVESFSKPLAMLVNMAESTPVRCADCAAVMPRSQSYAHFCAPQAPPGVAVAPRHPTPPVARAVPAAHSQKVPATALARSVTLDCARPPLPGTAQNATIFRA